MSPTILASEPLPTNPTPAAIGLVPPIHARGLEASVSYSSVVSGYVRNSGGWLPSSWSRSQGVASDMTSFFYLDRVLLRSQKKSRSMDLAAEVLVKHKTYGVRNAVVGKLVVCVATRTSFM